jgi:hypothetical protein
LQPRERHAGPDYVSYVGLPEELAALARQADCRQLRSARRRPLAVQRGILRAVKPTAYFSASAAAAAP